MTYQEGDAMDPALCRDRKKLWYAIFSLSFVGAIFFLDAGSVGLVAGHLVTKGVIEPETNRRNLAPSYKYQLRKLADKISGENSRKDESSPAGKAYNWLLVGNHNTEGELNERYCLAVLYFSLIGPSKRILNVISENYNGTLDISTSNSSTLLDIPENYNDAGTLDIPEKYTGDIDIPERYSNPIDISENNDPQPTPKIKQSTSMSNKELRKGLGISSLENESNWLKKKMSHCEWDGIKCDQNKRVTRIYLPGLGLTGTLPQGKELAKFSYLQMLNLGDNEIRGDLPGSLFPVASLRSLRHLHLQNNSLTGTVPSELANLVNLNAIYMGDNNFVGSIPTSIMNLPKLRYFSMLRNDLSGTIPETSRYLAYLDLGWNNFKGSLPPSLFSTFLEKKLAYLYVNNNELTGSIPREWNEESFSLLEEFHINDNLLTGIVPSIFSKVTAHTINLQNNIHLDIDPEICTRNAVLSGRGALVELGVNCDKCPCRRNIDMCNENKCYR